MLAHFLTRYTVVPLAVAAPSIGVLGMTKCVAPAIWTRFVVPVMVATGVERVAHFLVAG